jgi:mono/diheme cytochrome c family protein
VINSILTKSLLLYGALLAMMASSVSASGPEPAAIEFFEKKIRPVLAEHCYRCHSATAEKVKGGLMLDTKDGLLKGGETGPAITPGDPEKSLLIKAVRYTDENLQMPPKGKKLSAEQIADLEAWVKTGAADPRTGKVASKTDDIWSKAKTHWAFQPITKAPLPSVKTKGWGKNPIDAFVLAKLEAKNIKPSAPADKRALVRRATFDLTGLPPTSEEVNNFLKDKSPEAFAKVIDRLLASPRYGERWGRHWLDVARYADTKGYVFQEERRYPYSYTYRDYVIKAFNTDVPFDQFILQQVAADQLELGEKKEPLAAMGFLTLGRRFLNNQQDIIDDRIDVVSRGLMGLTVGCARCHDHKFDPIPTKDYYSLYGVFASSREPHEKPLLGITPPKHEEYLAEKKKREKNLAEFRAKKEAEAMVSLRRKVGEYLLAWHDFQHLADKSKPEQFAQEQKLDNGVLQRWSTSLEAWKKATNNIFTPWFAFSALDETNFPAKAKELAAQFVANTNKALNPIVAQAFTNVPTSIKQVTEIYRKLFNDTDAQWTKLLEEQEKQKKEVTGLKLADANWEELRQILYGAGVPADLPRAELDRLFDVPSGQHIAELHRVIDELDATHPGAPPRAMSMDDKTDAVTPHVFIRGNAGNQGAEVPRQFLQVLAGENRKPFSKGSGRLELAQAIVARNNPLTSRVLVNRVWLHHFGKGLVKTPSDFGLRSDPPTHPELLDWLALELMDNGWSLKKLHRTIMLSSTYQQRSEDDPESLQKDPGNALLWKMNRQRLEFEELRDSLLFVSGKLDLTMGGLPVDITGEPSAPRRTIYGYIDRQNLPGLFRTFDFANPDSTSAGRFYTTVPQQALFLLNSPFVVQQAQEMVLHTNFQKLEGTEKKVRYLYEKVYQREPDKMERKLTVKFIDQQSRVPLQTNQPLWQYGYGSVDGKSKRVSEFHAFTNFTKGRWQTSKEFPDPNTSYAMLDIEGGHPGNHDNQTVIRRWVSPFDGVIKIEGTLQHLMDKGDGVRSRVISSRKGEMGSWISFSNTVETIVQKLEVRRGDTIDFVTDARTGPAHDTFKWTSIINVVEVKYGTPPPLQTNWHSRREFEGPPKDTRPLTAWEKYAQALLLSNEFMFVD